MEKRYICVDIGGTAIKYGLVDEQARVLESDKMATKAWEGGPGILKRVSAIVERFAKGAQGICLSSAGMVDCDRGEIFYSGPTIPNYQGTRFKETLEKRYGLPCEIENDVNCAGLAEALSGAGAGAKSVLCLTVGTGIGGCFVLDGQVYRGFSGSACEVGYMKFSDNGRNFQEQGAASVLVARVAQLKGLEDEDRWSGPRIFAAARGGDADCVAAIDEMVRVLGRGIANICYVLNPQVVVLGGGIMVQEDYLLPRIRRSMEEELVSSIAEKTALRAARYQNEAGMVGAFYHYKSRHGNQAGSAAL